MYRIAIHHQIKKPTGFVPSEAKLKAWAKAALCHKVRGGELSICLVSKEDIRQLNKTYRHKDKPTNVLSFKADFPEGPKLKLRLLGDIVICSDIVNEEAKAQDKTPEAHWAHMVVHGSLHILGYDHEEDLEAEKMEAKEISILKKLGFANPYLEG